MAGSLVWGNKTRHIKKQRDRGGVGLRWPLFGQKKHQSTNSWRKQCTGWWRGSAARAEQMRGCCLFVRGGELSNAKNTKIKYAVALDGHVTMFYMQQPTKNRWADGVGLGEQVQPGGSTQGGWYHIKPCHTTLVQPLPQRFPRVGRADLPGPVRCIGNGTTMVNVCVCVFLASGYKWVTVMHEIPISSAQSMTSLFHTLGLSSTTPLVPLAGLFHMRRFQRARSILDRTPWQLLGG